MTAQPINPVAASSESMTETGFWTLLTVASISKQVGALAERALYAPELAAAVQEIESKLEAIILTSSGVSMHSALLALTQEVDYLKRS